MCVCVSCQYSSSASSINAFSSSIAILPRAEDDLLPENNRDTPGIRPNVLAKIITIISYHQPLLPQIAERRVNLDKREDGSDSIDVRDLLPADFMQYPSTVCTTREIVYDNSDATNDGEDS